MSRSTTVNLSLWSEIVGEYKAISNDNDFTYLEVGNLILEFQRGSELEKCVLDQLAGLGLRAGMIIGILHTDSLKEAFTIRQISK